jgi:hypothetical protein
VPFRVRARLHARPETRNGDDNDDEVDAARESASGAFARCERHE